MDVLLHLTLIQGVGPATVEKLVASLESRSLEALYAWDVKEFVAAGLSRLTAQTLVDGLADRNLLAAEQERLQRYNISFVTVQDQTFPEMLRQIYLPPLGLYVRGTLPSNYTKALTVVGSRKADAYSKQVINDIVGDLAQSGWTIVSGGALGADGYAHKITLQCQGLTVAIIGSGLLEPYPAAHKYLFDEIVAGGGAVMSPFPLTMQALPGNFPARNRLLAGISRATFVVQAAAKSGALITAYAALREGRDVCTVPGSIYDPLSSGCHRLLQEGAALVTTALDVEQLLGIAPSITREAHQSAIFTKDKDSSYQPIEKSMGQSDEGRSPLLVFCMQPRSFDALVEETKYTPELLFDQLWELQVSGLIEEVQCGVWQSVGNGSDKRR